MCIYGGYGNFQGSSTLAGFHREGGVALGFPSPMAIMLDCVNLKVSWGKYVHVHAW